MKRLLVPIQWLGRNLSTLLLSFLLALAVWVSAVLSADPNQECVIDVPIERTEPGEELVLLTTLPTTVELSFQSPQSVCAQMTENRSSIQAALDLSVYGEGEHEAFISLTIPDDYRPIRNLTYSPQRSTFELEELVTRTLPLMTTVTGEIDPGFEKDLPVWGASRIEITGRKSLVENVATASATLDIEGATETIETTLPITLQDADGRRITNVSYSPAEVFVSLPVSRLGTFRDVIVRVIYVGQPAEGFRLTNITPFPQEVTLFSSDIELLRELPGFVETNPIDISGATNDIEQRVTLVLPDGVTVSGENGASQSVLVTVNIAAIEASETRTVSVEVIGLDAGLQASIAPESLDVIVVGPAFLFPDLTEESIRVFLDVTGLEPGLHTLEPQVEILLVEMNAESLLPATIEVEISLLPTPTATPTPTPTLSGLLSASEPTPTPTP
jgi:YbbR domain-containing protein